MAQARARARRPGMHRVEKLFIKACPAHVDHLRRGIDGCFLEDRRWSAYRDLRRRPGRPGEAAAPACAM